jgi:hypothetical protein
MSVLGMHGRTASPALGKVVPGTECILSGTCVHSSVPCLVKVKISCTVVLVSLFVYG